MNLIIDNIDNIDNGIIEILKQKYKVDIYHESSLHYSSKIDINILKNNINFDYKYSNEVIDKYVSFNPDIYRCDIDIINLIIKCIVLKKKITKKKYVKKYSILDTINYYLGIKNTTNDNETNEQSTFSKKIVHKSIKSMYDNIHSDIINHFSLLS